MITIEIFDEGMVKLPMAKSVPDGECVSLLSVTKGNKRLELVIEPFEPENEGPAYSHSSYIIYEEIDDGTTDRYFGHDYFEEMPVDYAIKSLLAMI